MATVQMKKGNLEADIFDSPETIAQARKDGYSLVNAKAEPADTVNLSASAVEEQEKKQRGKRNPQ